MYSRYYPIEIFAQYVSSSCWNCLVPSLFSHTPAGNETAVERLAQFTEKEGGGGRVLTSQVLKSRPTLRSTPCPRSMPHIFIICGVTRLVVSFWRLAVSYPSRLGTPATRVRPSLLGVQLTVATL